MIDLEFVPHRAALLAGQDNTLNVVLRAKAPAAPKAQRERLALNLAVVIDRSGSMSGRSLAEAKRCATMIVDGLSSQDHASVVAYDSVVDVLVVSRPVDDKEFFRRAIAAIESRGMTALHDGWLTGAEQAAAKQNGQTLSRVLLLSDGCANQGLRRLLQPVGRANLVAPLEPAVMPQMGGHFSRNGMRSISGIDQDISHAGLVHGWPHSTASKLFDRAKRDLGGQAATIVLPEAACGDIGRALGELVGIVLALYPAWLPEAEGIDSPAGAGDAAVAGLARAAAEKTSLFGPLLLRLARAALAKQTSLVLDDIPRELVASECGKLVRASYRLENIVLILPMTRADEAEIQACERTALWLADHVRCAVWVAGPAAAWMPRISVVHDAISAPSPYNSEVPTGPRPAPPWVAPLAGRPNPFSAAEQRLEAHLAAQDWAVGRAWNQSWQADARHNRIVVDLVWKLEQLVIEVDGPDHLAAEKFAADRHRDRLLQLEGFTVLRFTNEEVLNDPVLVASQIERFLRQKRTMKES